MKRIITPTFATALAITLSGCASAPPTNARLSQLEEGLRAAYSDKYVAEYGNADLAKAEASLAAARVTIRKGHDEETRHVLSMAEGYISLGEIHGNQERAKAATVALKDRQAQIRLAARDRDINQANDRANTSQAEAAAAIVAAQNANDRADTSRANAADAQAVAQDANDRAAASRTDAATAQAATQAAEARTAAMRDQLRVYDLKFTALGATLVLRDVMFDVDSSLLRTGATNRLDPLITYLHANPATSVRIEGHTDNTGSSEHNNELSLNRANAVKRSLQANGTVSNAITTFGYGEDSPVATNATVSGREQNRRVEVTLQ